MTTNHSLALRRAAAPALLLVLGATTSGCLMTKSAGDALRDDTNRRISQLEAQNKQDRAELEQKLKQLEDVLDRATEVLKRGSADVGAQVSQLAEQIAAAEGQLSELKHRADVTDQQFAQQRADLDAQLATLRSSGASSAAPAAAAIPSDKKDHFQAAYTAYQAGDYDKARSLWREYLTRYPTDAKAGEAQYWIGASYTQQNKPATALGEYRKVISDYAQSSAVNVALYGMADAFYRLHACTDAKSALNTLIKRKPEASLLDRAKKLLKDASSAPKGYCTS
jgi:tol-pal system protein YbgF